MYVCVFVCQVEMGATYGFDGVEVPSKPEKEARAAPPPRPPDEDEDEDDDNDRRRFLCIAVVHLAS